MTRPGVEAVRGSHRGTNCGWSQTVGRSTDPVGWHGSRIRAAPSTKRGCHRWSGSRAVGLRVRLSVSEDESRMGADRFTKRGFWQSARSADSRGIGSRRAEPGIGTKRGFARIGSRRADPGIGTKRGLARIGSRRADSGNRHEARIRADRFTTRGSRHRHEARIRADRFTTRGACRRLGAHGHRRGVAPRLSADEPRIGADPSPIGEPGIGRQRGFARIGPRSADRRGSITNRLDTVIGTQHGLRESPPRSADRDHGYGEPSALPSTSASRVHGVTTSALPHSGWHPRSVLLPRQSGVRLRSRDPRFLNDGRKSAIRPVSTAPTAKAKTTD